MEYIFESFTRYVINERSESVRLRAIIMETGTCVYNCEISHVFISIYAVKIYMYVIFHISSCFPHNIRVYYELKT